jgi:hypothetical protein
MGARLQRLIRLWESAQVELHGKYSTARVVELSEYASGTSWAHAIAVLLVTPLPCLLVTVLVDVWPLDGPSDGVAANKWFFVRYYLTTGVLTFICIHQFRISMPVLSYPIGRALMHSFWIPGACIGITYGLVLVIGFPLPFTLISLTPAWIALISVSLVFEWMKKIKETPGAAEIMKNVLKVWLCQCALEFVYPPYYYVFTTLSDRGQLGFALLLPLIKLSMRNIFAQTVVHLSDEMSEVVVFNVEVFNALFVSYCMQNSPSVWATLELMLVDIAMIILSVRDMENTRHGLKALEQRIDKEKSWSSYCGAMGYADLGGRVPTTLERTRILLEEGAKRTELHPVQSRQEVLQKVPLEWKKKATKSFAVVPANIGHVLEDASKHRHPTPSLLSAKVLPVVSAAGNVLIKKTTKLRYTRKVRKLLYMAEFLLLLNYIEVVIPLVFCKYLDPSNTQSKWKLADEMPLLQRSTCLQRTICPTARTPSSSTE